MQFFKFSYLFCVLKLYVLIVALFDRLWDPFIFLVLMVP